MAKLPMCRICLVDNVRMFLVADKNLQKIYEKLTDVAFVTEDSRPMFACYFCYTKLKHSYQLQSKCLEAEELFDQMMNNYKLKSLPNRGHSEFVGGFVKTVLENISIVDDGQTDSGTIEIEIPAVSPNQCDIVKIKVECQSDEDDLPLMELKTEVVEVKKETEEQEVSKTKQRGKNTKRVTVAKKPKLDIGRTKVEDARKAEKQTRKDKSDSNVIQTTQNCTSKPGTYFKDPLKSHQRSVNLVEKKIQHTPTRVGEKPYKCDVCQSSFSQKSNLTQHIRIHTGEKPYKCEVCQRSFSEKGTLKKHIRIHTGEKPYKCKVCQRSFSVKSNLSSHIRIHTGEKPYKCDVCQRSFLKNDHLTNHIHVHTGEKPYQCDVCLRSFSDKSYLILHIRIHTGEKPYKCDLCQRSFKLKSHLSQHIRIHTGEEPYKCDVCRRSFSRNSALRNHIRSHTGEKL